MSHEESQRTYQPPLTWESSREEVLAYIAEDEASSQRAHEIIAAAQFPDVPEGFEGCVWSLDGKVRARYGRIEVPEHLARQQRAGEENQDDGEWAIG